MTGDPVLDGPLIADCREALRLPKSALADAVGVSDRVLRTIEAGEPVPYLPLVDVARLAEALGVPIARLFPGEAVPIDAGTSTAAMSLVRALVLARGAPVLSQGVVDGLRIAPAELNGVIEQARAVLRPAGLSLRVTYRHIHLIPEELADPVAQAILNAAALRSLSAIQVEIVLHSLHRLKTTKRLLHSARTGPPTQGLVKAGILIAPDKETDFYEVNDEVRYSLMLDPEDRALSAAAARSGAP